MNAANESDAEIALDHFLRLALAQLQSRLRATAVNGELNHEVRRLRLLEELIKEQLPDENTGSATRASR